MGLSGDTRVRLSETQVSSRLDQEVVILDLQSSSYLGLADLGARLWQLLAQSIAVAEIERIICEEYEVDPDTCRRDVREFLAQVISRGLVVVDAEDT